MTIDNPTCAFDAFNVDQAQDAAGAVHGSGVATAGGTATATIVSLTSQLDPATET